MWDENMLKKNKLIYYGFYFLLCLFSGFSAVIFSLLGKHCCFRNITDSDFGDYLVIIETVSGRNATYTVQLKQNHLPVLSRRLVVLITCCMTCVKVILLAIVIKRHALYFKLLYRKCFSRSVVGEYEIYLCS